MEFLMSCAPAAIARAPRAAAARPGAGRSFPLGATIASGGVNFSVFSRQATRVELLLFDDAAAAKPARVINLDRLTHSPSSRVARQGRLDNRPRQAELSSNPRWSNACFECCANSVQLSLRQRNGNGFGILFPLTLFRQ
jgi:pullulanase/glycogen debranching enzyme